MTNGERLDSKDPTSLPTTEMEQLAARQKRDELLTHCVLALTLEQFELLHPNIQLGQE